MEINDSFYLLPRPKSYRAWYEATPEGFVFSIKRNLPTRCYDAFAPGDVVEQPQMMHVQHIDGFNV
jgi:Protein of unknown function DUF72